MKLNKPYREANSMTHVVLEGEVNEFNLKCDRDHHIELIQF